jgi:predicted RND superfamily exporter protein
MTLNPPALSKINWANIIGGAATLLTVFGIDLSPEMQASIVAGIALVTQLVTVVFRTFFTGTTP